MAAKKKMGRPRKPADQKMSAGVNVRLDQETAARVDALAARVASSGMGRSTIVRLCLIAGLDLAEKDPGRVLLGVRR